MSYAQRRNLLQQKSLVGKIALDLMGIPGRITGATLRGHPLQLAWIGVDLRKGGEWWSFDPEIVAESIEEYQNQP